MKITLIVSLAVMMNAKPGRWENVYGGAGDVGSNLGIQVRKLFEPSLYPEAKINRYFNILFGNDTVRKHELKENDILIYLDAGCTININRKKRFNEYINVLMQNKKSIIWSDNLDTICTINLSSRIIIILHH